MSHLRSPFRGAGWGCLTSLVGGAVFWFLFLVPIASDDAYYPEALLFASFILTIVPASILGTIGGMILDILIHLNESIGSSTLACASAGGIVGLATTSLLVFLFGLGGFDIGFLPLRLYAMLIGTIAGSIAGWKLVRRA